MFLLPLGWGATRSKYLLLETMNVLHSVDDTIPMLFCRNLCGCYPLRDQLLQLDISLIDILEVQHFQNIFVDIRKNLLILFILNRLLNQLVCFLQISYS